VKKIPFQKFYTPQLNQAGSAQNEFFFLGVSFNTPDPTPLDEECFQNE
jgi:hypothetical protein